MVLFWPNFSLNLLNPLVLLSGFLLYITGFSECWRCFPRFSALSSICDLSPYDNPTISSVGVLVLTRSIFPSLVRAVSDWLVRYNRESALRFPAKENPNMKKALFDWPMVLQYNVKTKYRLISREVLGHEFFFHQSVRLTNQKPRPVFISVR